MAEMNVNINVDERSQIVALQGEHVIVKILNPDGTEKNTVIDTVVPSGKTFNGAVAIYGKLE